MPICFLPVCTPGGPDPADSITWLPCLLSFDWYWPVGGRRWEGRQESGQRCPHTCCMALGLWFLSGGPFLSVSSHGALASLGPSVPAVALSISTCFVGFLNSAHPSVKSPVTKFSSESYLSEPSISCCALTDKNGKWPWRHHLKGASKTNESSKICPMILPFYWEHEGWVKGPQESSPHSPPLSPHPLFYGRELGEKGKEILKLFF